MVNIVITDVYRKYVSNIYYQLIFTLALMYHKKVLRYARHMATLLYEKQIAVMLLLGVIWLDSLKFF